MRFLHTGDWHLGRLFHGVHLTDDQADLLCGDFLQLVRDARPDAVLIAGDVYDRSLPPPEAMALLDEVLCRLVLDLKITVVLIAGNHDSPQRLQFGSRLLDDRGLHIRGTLGGEAAPVILHDRHGPVSLCPLPYAEPAYTRAWLGRDDIHTHDEAMRATVERMRTQLDGGRSILVAHAFVTGGQICDSERPISVGGTGEVGADCLDGFDYVALGHLHAPQRIGANVHYAGSLMKYSFSEAPHHKSVGIVEMDERGACRIERVPLRPRRDVRRVEGYLQDLLEGGGDLGGDGGGRDDYLEVTLLDEGAVFDAIGRLRAVYPDVLHVQRKFRTLPENRAALEPAERHRLSHLDLFRSFHAFVAGEEMTPEQDAAFATIVETMAQDEREADA